jgi:cation:H+ antiporter
MSFLVYLVSFFLIWKGAELIVDSVSKLAHRLRISAFSISFFVLGVLTSIPEITVGINSVIKGTPEVFAGDLLGGTLTLFIFVIPLLAVLGNGLSLKHELDKKHLLITLLVIILPVLLLLDSRIALLEALVMIGFYVLLFYILEHRQYEHQHLDTPKNFHWLKDALKIIIGVCLVAISSYFLVDKTVEFARFLNISPFVISFIVMGLGTNLPEISLVLRAAVSGRKDIAFGDFLGSAVANTVVMGGLTMLNRRTVIIPANFFVQSIFIFGAIFLFYYFSSSGQNITRREGAVLLSIYILFLLLNVCGNIS